MSYKKNQSKGMKYSHSLKNRATKEELMLKKELENNDIWFKFQAFFFDDKKLFIPDFRLSNRKSKILIEVDGKNHSVKKQAQYDIYRTEWLAENRNCRVLRFKNKEVRDEMDKVIKEILKLNPLTNTEKLKNEMNSETYNKMQELDNEFSYHCN